MHWFPKDAIHLMDQLTKKGGGGAGALDVLFIRYAGFGGSAEYMINSLMINSRTVGIFYNGDILSLVMPCWTSQIIVMFHSAWLILGALT